MTNTPTFKDLNLESNLLSAVESLGYESPTPIQAESIPVLLQGNDLLAQAQTGTGKTAAFVLPILSNLDMDLQLPQALIMAPTRELAIQVAEACQQYAKHMNNFRVTSIYGGQDYQIQLKALKRNPQIIVGTPGRLMDHMRRGSLDLSDVHTVVLDEADEMLRMGFVDDIEWILEHVPDTRQTALFSATLPTSIKKIVKNYLNDPIRIHIKAKTQTVDRITQFYIRANKDQKLDILTRFLEVGDVDAAIIFSRTKTWAVELAEKLQARGYAASALQGDMKQSQREKTLERLKKGKLDIIVATDVAARGIDVDRITHVFNYDIPGDGESYVHRIGRTGRAGRKGTAILFVGPREKSMLREIEDTIGMQIAEGTPPSREELIEFRRQNMAVSVQGVIEKSKKLGPYRELVSSLVDTQGFDAVDIAAALAYLLEQNNPLPDDEFVAGDFEKSEKKKKGGRSKGGRGHRGKSNASGARGGNRRGDSRGDSRSRDRKKPAGKSDRRGRTSASPGKKKPSKKKSR